MQIYKTLISGTRPSVRLIEGVRLTGGPLNRGFTVWINHKTRTFPSLSHSDKTHLSTFWAFHRPKWQISLPFHIHQLVKSLRTLSYTYGLWKEALWAGPSRIGRYKEYPQGFMAVSQTTFSIRTPEVPWQLKGWSQGYCHAELLKSVHKVLHGNTVYNLPFPYREGGGGKAAYRLHGNCRWWWYSRWPVVSPTSRYFRLRPLKSFTLLNVRSFRSRVSPTIFFHG